MSLADNQACPRPMIASSPVRKAGKTLGFPYRKVSFSSFKPWILTGVCAWRSSAQHAEYRNEARRESLIRVTRSSFDARTRWRYIIPSDSPTPFLWIFAILPGFHRWHHVVAFLFVGSSKKWSALGNCESWRFRGKHCEASGSFLRFRFAMRLISLLPAMKKHLWKKAFINETAQAVICMNVWHLWGAYLVHSLGGGRPWWDPHYFFLRCGSWPNPKSLFVRCRWSQSFRVKHYKL